MEDPINTVIEWFFMFEHILASSVNERGKPYRLLVFINEQALWFVSDIFIVSKTISEHSAVYNTRRTIYLRKFSVQQHSKEIITPAFEAQLDLSNLQTSM